MVLLETCKKHNITFLKSTGCPLCKQEQVKALEDIKPEQRLRTPSDLDVPVHVVCPPIFQEIYVDNNIYMEELDEKIKKKFSIDALFRQWYDFISVLSQYALVLTLPPNPTLQDLVWCNQALYLPHIDELTCVISNFKAEGRQPESDVMEWFLQEMGYKTYRIPKPDWFFEGFPDMKWLKDNIYIAGFGERTTEESLDWISQKFDCNIIKLAHTDEYLYHADTCFCILAPDKVMAVIPSCDKKQLRVLEKYAEVIPIEDKKLGEYCITNNVVVGYTIMAGTYIDMFEPDSEDWIIEMKKIEKLQEISVNYGYDLLLFEIGQFLAQGAGLSCVTMCLNYTDKQSMQFWSETTNGKK